MDPDEALDEIRDITDDLRGHIEDELAFGEEQVDKTDRLIDLVKAVDERAMTGGNLPSEWAMRCNGGLLKRAALAQSVYNHALETAETFEGDLGMQMTYLLGAILTESNIELDVLIAEEAEVLEFFEAMFPKEHLVWGYIEVKNRLAAVS